MPFLLIMPRFRAEQGAFRYFEGAAARRNSLIA
jgi:hypothetical protein